MTKILGVSAFFHDSAATLISNGEIIAAAQEERFTRKKHDKNFPINAINFVLEEGNSRLKDIDYIVFFEKPFLKFERLIKTYLAFIPRGFKSFSVAMPVWLKEKLFQKKFIFNQLKKIDDGFDSLDKIKFSEHHFSHAASAFYPSPYDKSIILTIDGVGEWATTTVAIGTKNKISIIKEIHFPHSLGLLYSAITYYLGFKVNSGEYKVMGLAPYGNPIFKDLILKNLIDVKEDGTFKLNMKYFDFATGLKMTNNKFSNLFGNPVRKKEGELLTQFHMDVASSVQAVTEEIVLKLAKNLSQEYKINNLCMAGGVALNCVANGKILKEKIFNNVWIQPASGDAGGSLGAALGFWYQELNKERTISSDDSMKGSYLGPRFNNKIIKKKLDDLKANYVNLEERDLLNIVAKMISEQKTVGWFQGRMEFGPRALGNRSIIADPRSDKMQKELNLKIKFRESFRPFAPAVLFEEVQNWFELNHKSPYMLLVANINNNLRYELNESQKNLFGIEKLNIKRSKIPAVTHIDYSARVQTVHSETNPRFYRLIKKFYELSNCPILVNTSFNIRGEPIVCSIEDAFKCFMGTDLDILVIENFVMFKDQQNVILQEDYKNKFELD